MAAILSSISLPLFDRSSLLIPASVWIILFRSSIYEESSSLLLSRYFSFNSCINKSQVFGSVDPGSISVYTLFLILTLDSSSDLCDTFPMLYS